MYLHQYLIKYFLHYLIALGSSRSLYNFSLKASFSRHNRPKNYSIGIGFQTRSDLAVFFFENNRLFSNQRPDRNYWLISPFKDIGDNHSVKNISKLNQSICREKYMGVRTYGISLRVFESIAHNFQYLT